MSMLRSKARQIPLSYCLTHVSDFYLGILEVNREAYKIPERKLRHLIHILTANGIRYASGLVQPSARYIHTCLYCNAFGSFASTVCKHLQLLKGYCKHLPWSTCRCQDHSTLPVESPINLKHWDFVTKIVQFFNFY